jgi:hypothetical protein
VAAAARVGKPESMRDLAQQHQVDLANVQFPEIDDIAALRDEGLLTARDEQELAAAEESVGSADAYANTLKAALACLLQG